jgi:hypothetical protein
MITWPRGAPYPALRVKAGGDTFTLERLFEEAFMQGSVYVID